jgi:hypothetical protein
LESQSEKSNPNDGDLIKERVMGNELVEKGNSQLPAEFNANEFNSMINVTAQDLLVPKLLPMQGLSQLVTAGQAQMGEIRNSVTGELMGHIDKPMEVYPFFIRKSWDIHKKQPDGQFKYEKNIPVIENPQDPNYNAKLDRMGIEEGIEVKRVFRYDYFILLPSDIAKGEAFPYVLSFKSSSRRNGQKIISEWGRMVDAGKPYFMSKFELFGARQKNEKGTFVVLDVKRGTLASQQELMKAADWIKRITTTSVKVDESDVVEDEMTVGATDTVSNEF